MAYRLWLPGDPEPGDDPADQQNAATESARSSAAAASEPTPHEIFLTKVAPAFQRLNRRLLPLLADRWLGASEKIRCHAPAVDEAINRAEERADEMARRFMAGMATEAQFLAAVAEYEETWRRGAAVVEAVDAAGGVA